MNAPELTVQEVQLFERPVRFRLPFRFGASTVREAPQAFVRTLVRLADGREAWGATAELMVPKWFDKNPELSNEANFDQLRHSLRLAATAYTSDRTPQTAYGLSAAHYAALVKGRGSGLNPLTAAFGPAQLDKAIVDALCRAHGVSFPNAVRENLVGLAPEPLAPDLAGFDVDALLRGFTLPPSIHARHTVGLADPLTATDAGKAEPLDDGLPETLEQVIARYGHRYFKIKIGGLLAEDLERLGAIAEVLRVHCADYRVTLDGNERYQDVGGVLELWQSLRTDPRFEHLIQRVLYVEQPIERSVTLEQDVTPLAREVPVIVDEADGTVGTFLRARRRGYTGISSKACKGIYKSLLNAARCRVWNEGPVEPRFFLSAEDLTCQAGLAVQQDLALVGMLGLDHVERNGHHYVHGMVGADAAEQANFLHAHAGLYARVGGRTCLDVKEGRLDLDSLSCVGFAAAAEPNWDSMRELAPENRAHG